jgi:hypothetical protein
VLVSESRPAGWPHRPRRDAEKVSGAGREARRSLSGLLNVACPLNQYSVSATNVRAELVSANVRGEVWGAVQIHLRTFPSADDFQRRNLVPEFEKESKVNGAAGENFLTRWQVTTVIPSFLRTRGSIRGSSISPWHPSSTL